MSMKSEKFNQLQCKVISLFVFTAKKSIKLQMYYVSNLYDTYINNWYKIDRYSIPSPNCTQLLLCSNMHVDF